MRKFITVCSFIGILAVSGKSFGATYSFDQTFDHWGLLQTDFHICTVDSILNPNLTFTYNLNPYVNFAAGDLVVNSTLELQFAGDLDDTYYQVFLPMPFGYADLLLYTVNHLEFVHTVFDDAHTEYLGEVDNGPTSINVAPSYINDDGFLKVEVVVEPPYIGSYNNDLDLLWTPWINLDDAILHVTVETLGSVPGPGPAPVPEPSTVLLLGSGLVGLAAYRRGKRMM
jgi:hypothetical protein